MNRREALQALTAAVVAGKAMPTSDDEPEVIAAWWEFEAWKEGNPEAYNAMLAELAEPKFDPRLWDCLDEFYRLYDIPPSRR